MPSAYLGGYDVTPSEGISSAGSTFKLPAVTCPDAQAFELDGFGQWIDNADGNFYAPGGDTDAFAVGSVICNYGVPEYAINADAGGIEQDLDSGISAGDMIRTRVEELPSGAVTATTTDLTSGQSVTEQGTSSGDEAQIQDGFFPDVADQVGQNDFGIPKFKPVTIRSAQIGSLPIADVSSTPDELVGGDGPVELVPGAFHGYAPSQFRLNEKSYQ